MKTKVKQTETSVDVWALVDDQWVKLASFYYGMGRYYEDAHSTENSVEVLVDWLEDDIEND